MRSEASDQAAQRRLRKILEIARAIPGLRRRLWPGSMPVRVEVTFVGAARMKSLNTKYRRSRYATDVLSFVAPTPFRRLGYLGELVLCGPVLERQAREQGHSARRELDVLLVHGLLHLLGFDHERDPRRAVEMARWEQRLLSALGKPRGLIARARPSCAPPSRSARDRG